MGTIYIILGVSGSGKGTIKHRLLAHHPELFEPVSATTRAPRPGEEHEVHYVFVSEPEFLQMIERKEFLEYTMGWGGNYYGVIKAQVDKALADGKDILLDVDFQGAEFAAKHFPSVKSVFLCPPSTPIQRQRLMQRGTTGHDLEERLEGSLGEIAWAIAHKVPMIVNDDLEETVHAVEELLFGASAEASPSAAQPA